MREKSKVQKLIAIVMAIALITAQAPIAAYAQDTGGNVTLSKLFPGEDRVLAEAVRSSIGAKKDIDSPLSDGEQESYDSMSSITIGDYEADARTKVDLAGLDHLGDKIRFLELYNLDISESSWSLKEILKALPNVERLYIVNTNIRGDLSDLSSLTNLEYLTIQDCAQISGDISNLPTGINELVLNGSGIIGNVSKLGNLNNVMLIDLSNTNISGTLSDLPIMSIHSLDLSNTSINGNLSDLPIMSIYSLDLSNTSINGNLSDFSKFQNLGDINLSGTKVLGDLNELPKMELYSLDLSNTSIEGDLVSLAGKFTDEYDDPTLQSLYLAHTEVEGDMNNDNTAALLRNLRSFDLSNTNIHGDVEWIGNVGSSGDGGDKTSRLEDLSYTYPATEAIKFSDDTPNPTIKTSIYMDRSKKSIEPDHYYISDKDGSNTEELTGDNLPAYTQPSANGNIGTITWKNPGDMKEEGILSYTFNHPITIAADPGHDQPEIKIPYSGTVNIPFTNTMTPSGPKVKILTTDIKNECKVGEPYEQIIEVSRSNSSDTVLMSVDTGSLPYGLSLEDTTGTPVTTKQDVYSFTISGTPLDGTKNGTYNFTLKAYLENNENVSDTHDYGITLSGSSGGTLDPNKPYVEILTTTIDDCKAGTPYSQLIEVQRNNSAEPVYMNISGGSLPAGLSLIPESGSASDGEVVGTHNPKTGNFDFRIDGTPASDNKNGDYKFKLNAYLKDTIASHARNYTLNLSGGSGGDLQPSVAILTEPKDIVSSCKVNEPYSLPDGQLIEVKRSNSDKPVYMKVTEGSLPDGLSLGGSSSASDVLGTYNQETGNFEFRITGTPIIKGDYSFTLTAFIDDNIKDVKTYIINVTKDEGGSETSKPYVNILTNSISLNNIQIIEVKSGNTNSPVYMRLANNSHLPDGVVLTGSAISGTAIVGKLNNETQNHEFTLLSSGNLQPGIYEFVLEAFLNDGTKDTRHFTLTVPKPTISIVPRTLPNGKVNNTYEQTVTVTVTNSDLPAYMTVSSGQLPTGLSLKGANTSGSALDVLNETGNYEFTIAGTPTQSGTFEFYLQAFLDENTVSAEKKFTITIDSRSGGGSSSSRPSTTTTTPAADTPALNHSDHVQYMDLYSDGSFMPDRPITRGEVAAAFARLLVPPIDMSETYECSFPDVAADYAYKNHIGFLEQYSILRGYPDGTFRPDDYITRAEFAAVAARFDKLEDVKGTIFTDIDENNMWALPSINSAYKKGWVEGYEGNLFKPNQNLTRAEFTKIISRMLGRSIDENSIKGKAITAPKDTSTDHWAYYYVIESLKDHDYTIDDDNHEVWK